MNDRGPAFPTIYEIQNMGITEVHYAYGMSLRDYFAGQALAGLAQQAREDVPDQMVEYAYSIADAMIAKREKGGR